MLLDYTRGVSEQTLTEYISYTTVKTSRSCYCDIWIFISRPISLPWFATHRPNVTHGLFFWTLSPDNHMMLPAPPGGVQVCICILHPNDSKCHTKSTLTLTGLCYNNCKYKIRGFSQVRLWNRDMHQEAGKIFALNCKLKKQVPLEKAQLHNHD